ncbi:hypothetical protein C8J56DRAFT_257500 [Mycena floridula]|nr:hypothetical protein C8J56DRAFT_257500 [Mycena floridula]
MGGPYLEVFKFSLYLLVPIGALVHFGDPEWYRQHVIPVRDKYFLQNKGLQSVPTNQQSLREELARRKLERLEKRSQIEEAAQKQ